MSYPPTPENQQQPYQAPQQYQAPPASQSHHGLPQPAHPSLQFQFKGGAATYVGTGIAGFLVTVLTLGICYPWAIVMVYRWRTKHTYINGLRLRFTGDAWGLFGNWIKWLILIIITAGIYSFWVVPRLTKWITEHQQVDPRQF